VGHRDGGTAYERTGAGQASAARNSTHHHGVETFGSVCPYVLHGAFDPTQNIVVPLWVRFADGKITNTTLKVPATKRGTHSFVSKIFGQVQLNGFLTTQSLVGITGLISK
jgi:hypothetical protein